MSVSIKDVVERLVDVLKNAMTEYVEALEPAIQRKDATEVFAATGKFATGLERVNEVLIKLQEQSSDVISTQEMIDMLREKGLLEEQP